MIDPNQNMRHDDQTHVCIYLHTIQVICPNIFEFSKPMIQPSTCHWLHSHKPQLGSCLTLIQHNWLPYDYVKKAIMLCQQLQDAQQSA